MATLKHHHDEPIHYTAPPKVNAVSTQAPMQWLKKGLADLKASPIPSLLYGLFFTVAGLLMTWLAAANPLFIMAIITGFLLVGPFIAIGLYDISHQLEKGKQPRLLHAFSALKFNSISLVSFAFVLGIMMVAWTRLSALIAGFSFNSVSLTESGWSALFSNEHSVQFLFVFMLAGLAMALIAFAISVVSIPMMTDRKVDVITAMITSVQAVIKNPLPMLIWAGLIVALIGVGMAFFYIGLIVALPIVGHASWHAYRALVAEE